MRNKFLLVFVIGVVMTLPAGSTGTPDYGKSLSSNPTIQSFEAGEDATRILMGGGSNSRAGRWLWATGFETSLAEVVESSTGITLDTATVYQGAKAAKFTTDAINGNQKHIFKTIFIPQNANADNIRVGQEIMFSPQLTFGQAYVFDFQIQTRRDAASCWDFTIRYFTDGTSSSIYYRDAAGAYILIANISDHVVSNIELFHFVKLVADIKNNRLVSFAFDDLYFVIDSPAYSFVNPLAAGSALFVLNITTQGAWSSTVRVDNWVLTSDEP